ncbi:uncharacterized protein LOC133745252 isoform X3 [Rosa rugosa]|uniref:uncharacterized protein LOC133745252 isoform X3 n=1 Tax=Rosa rugosa TaxID=74645 RepID=UPI002B412DD7|nr:uncharacterized protein LOC133745252 isoform X3 [Rosa rugosa]
MRNDATSDIQFMISLSRMLMATMWILVCTRGMFYLLSMLPNVCVPKACFTYSQSILENSIAPNLFSIPARIKSNSGSYPARNSIVLTEGKQKDVLKAAGALFSHICEV